jgi:hypothetical protein
MENLYIYGEANGLILDIAVDASNQLVDKLFVAGSFDTERKTSQIQLCSAGGYDGLKYDGLSFTKVATTRCDVYMLFIPAPFMNATCVWYCCRSGRACVRRKTRLQLPAWLSTPL